MSKVDKLLEKARNNPQGLRFSDLCRLTKAFGFEWVHGEGSHRVYGRAGVRKCWFSSHARMVKPKRTRYSSCLT